MSLFQVLTDSHRLDDDLSTRKQQSGHSLHMGKSYAVGVNLAVLFSILPTLEEMDETKFMRDTLYIGKGR